MSKYQGIGRHAGSYCHYRMRGFVTVLSTEEFQKWMDEKVKEAIEAAADPFR